MNIYTGYYGNMRAYRGMQCVAISLSVPSWAGPLPNIRSLNPEGWMMHLENEEYVQAFQKILDRNNGGKIITSLEALSGPEGKDVVLLCYEKPGLLCHRHLVARWLQEKSGRQVSEFYERKSVEMPVAVKPEPPKPAQLDLFALPPVARRWD